MPFTITSRIREERRKRAEERQAEYDKLTLEQKIERLPPEPRAKRQRDRLMSELKKAQEVKEVVAVKPAKVKKVKKEG